VAGEPAPLETFSGRALGSRIRLHVRPAGASPAVHGDVVGAAAWAAVRAELDAVDLALSRFRDDSELTALNRLAGTGGEHLVSWRLRAAIATVRRAARLTGGRFDARVLGALERIGEHGATLAAAMPGPSLDPDTNRAQDDRSLSRVASPAAPLDLGGIGKGLALRWAAAAAQQALPPGAGLLLEAGGDIIASGDPPPGGWLVGIEDPVADPGADAPPVAVLALCSGAVATSSIAVRNWIGPDGRPVHHLIDPRTGEPARTGLIAVTVAAPDPAWAEVWSKALFMGSRSSIGDEARAQGFAAWWIDDRGRLGMTPAARVTCAWVAEERLG
jgi:thiamine biosynthesis lipoprotein